jgi:hypothetical protein
MEKYKNHSDLSDWILWVSRNDTKAAKIGRQDKLPKSNAGLLGMVPSSALAEN